MPNLQTILLAIAACFLWSTAFLGLKLAMAYESPVVLAGERFILAGALLFGYLVWTSRTFLYWWREAISHFRSIFIVSLFQSFLVYIFINLGVAYCGPAITALVVGLSPVTIALIAHFYVPGDRLNLRKSVSLGLGVTGLATLVLPELLQAEINQPVLFGMGLLLLSNLSSAVGNITVATYRRGIHPVLLNSFQLFFGGIVLFITGWVFEHNLDPALLTDFISRPAAFYWTLLWLASLSAIAFSIWFYLLQQPDVQVSNLNIWKFIMPVNGAILSWAFLPESPTMYSLLAMCAIGSAVIVGFWPASWSPRRRGIQ